ncbi:hypothetical protein O3M35_005316 [Rhynocoris fuscipes]|uniref:Ig-like domain-containing protein n=1 Tax=Rhynocoris fuscipes TaxID=488301 RepID=A0AAW1DNR1_9HEMI
MRVPFPPTIMELSGGGTVEVRKGTPVTLECRAKGNPPPFYQWTRRVRTVPKFHSHHGGFVANPMTLRTLIAFSSIM